MLDETTQNSEATTRDWRDAVSPGDVLRYAFPVAGPFDHAPEPQPCLVVDVLDLEGARFVALAFGARAKPGRRRPLDVRVNRPAEIRAAGCRRRTVFRGDLRLLVSLDNAGFMSAPASSTPVLGRLTASSFGWLAVVRMRIARARAARRRRTADRQDVKACRRR